MKEVAQEFWISIAQRPTKRYYPSVAVILGTLLVGAAAVAHRSVLCQLQAYTILVVSFVAFAFYVQHVSAYHECTVETLREPFCVDCASTSRGAMLVGHKVKSITSSYERFYMSMPRVHLIAFVWLAWIAYGAVFHEAQHTAAEDAYVSGLIHQLSHGPMPDRILPHLRTARVVVLWINACAAAYEMPFAHKSVYTAIVFFVLLFVPTAQSTAQAQDTIKLLARTAVFVTLFAMSEALSRAQHYQRWLTNYNEAYHIHLSGLLMALGVAKQHKMKRAHTSNDILFPVDEPPPTLALRNFSIDAHLRRWSVVVQSAWILVASDMAIAFAMVQLMLMLFWLAKSRSAALEIATGNPLLLRVRNVTASGALNREKQKPRRIAVVPKQQPEPEPSPPPPPPPPPMDTDSDPEDEPKSSDAVLPNQVRAAIEVMSKHHSAPRNNFRNSQNPSLAIDIESLQPRASSIGPQPPRRKRQPVPAAPQSTDAPPRPLETQQI